MRKNHLINLSMIFYFISIIVLTKPPYLGTIKPISYIYNMLFPFVAFLVIVLSIKNNSINKMILLIMLFYLAIFVPTLIYDGDLKSFFTPFITNISYVLLINLGLKKEGKNFIKIISFIYFAYTVINLLSMIIFPNGLYLLENIEHSWFLGHKNGLIKWILPGFVFVASYDLLLYNKLKIKSYIYLLIMAISIFISESTTSTISVVILIVLLYLFINKGKRFNIINIKSAVILNISFLTGVCILNLHNNFSNIFQFLGKNSNFTGRDSLWSRILVYIKDKPILGHGLSNSNTMQRILNYSNSSSHNLVLDYLYQGGIICILIFGIILFKLNKSLNLIKNTKLCRVLNIVFFCFSIIWLTDTFLGNNLMNVFAIIIFGYNLHLIEAEKLEENKNTKKTIIA